MVDVAGAEEVTHSGRGKAFTEIGSTGLMVWSGLPQDEFLPDLRGARGRRIFREMSDNDPVIGAMLLAITQLFRQVDWPVEAAMPPDADDEEEPTDQAREVADFVTSCFNDMSTSWDDTLASIATFLIYGWSWHEIVYKVRRGPMEKRGKYRSRYSDGKVGWRRWPIRGQHSLDRWFLDDHGQVKGMRQRIDGDLARTKTGDRSNYRTMPIERSLLFRTTEARGNPEGRSMLRNAYRPWWFKRRLEEIQAIGVERDLAGLPVFYVPAEMTSDDATAEQVAALNVIKDIVRRVRRDEQEGMVIPMAYDDNNNPLYDFKLLNAGGQRQFAIGEIIASLNQQIVMTMLADFLLIGHEGVGSYALGSSKIDFFSSAVEGWAAQIRDVINDHAIPRLMQINGIEPELWPRVTFETMQPVDPAPIVEAIASLSAAGAPLFPNLKLTKHILAMAGIPESVVIEPEAMEEEQAAYGAAMPQNMLPGGPLAPDPEPDPARDPDGGAGNAELKKRMRAAAYKRALSESHG